MRKEPTRTITCRDCSAVFDHVGRGCRYYCAECRRKRDIQKTNKWKIKNGLLEKPGVGSGGNQWGANNSQWKDGRIAYKKLGRVGAAGCVRCGKVDEPSRMCVHHKDENRANNDPSNLELVCKSCHQNHCHPNARDEYGRYKPK
jgi:hypothetical protein